MSRPRVDLAQRTLADDPHAGRAAFQIASFLAEYVPPVPAAVQLAAAVLITLI